ncbi:hypothetical protein M569_15157 [Genlisea aurea]|uniref:Uncharacterized protein n=1 Tax=Genlisea aurea TaxID=192259 RepID=S8BYH1_9LAMI|nr:hypothetical protein M569_15157 [Genlisea aurea]
MIIGVSLRGEEIHGLVSHSRPGTGDELLGSFIDPLHHRHGFPELICSIRFFIVITGNNNDFLCRLVMTTLALLCCLVGRKEDAVDGVVVESKAVCAVVGFFTFEVELDRLKAMNDRFSSSSSSDSSCYGIWSC